MKCLRGCCIVCGVLVDRNFAEYRNAMFFTCTAHNNKWQGLMVSIRDLLCACRMPIADNIGLSPGMRIVREVAAKYKISLDLIRDRRRRLYIQPNKDKRADNEPSLFVVRSEVARRLRFELKLSYPVIGRLLGGRDHTTVMRMVDEEFRRRHLGRMRLRDYRRTMMQQAAE